MEFLRSLARPVSLHSHLVCNVPCADHNVVIRSPAVCPPTRPLLPISPTGVVSRVAKRIRVAIAVADFYNGQEPIGSFLEIGRLMNLSGDRRICIHGAMLNGYHMSTLKISNTLQMEALVVSFMLYGIGQNLNRIIRTNWR